MSTHKKSRGIILLALFVSGFAGLMHEVIWAKFLARLIGNTAASNSVVLTVFMAGLAIGAIAFGKRADRMARPLMAYVWLEILIGAYCLVLPILLRLVTAFYEGLAAQFYEQTSLTLLLRLALALLVVLPPAVLMGGTLPILAKYLVAEVAQTRKQVASLYALNNLGAVAGSGLAGFYALPAFGIFGALAIASVMNLLAAALVFGAERRGRERGSRAGAAAAPLEAAMVSAYGPSQYFATLAALALSGFAAMGYEVMFIRVIALSFGSSTYSFTVMLMCFIAGIGLGSAVISRINVRRPLVWLGVSQLMVVASLALVAPLMERLPYFVGLLRVALFENPAGFELDLLGKALLCMLVLLVPTMCMGISFPLVTQVQARSVKNIGGTVGSTYAWNTAGNVVGILVTTHYLLSHGGILRAFEVSLALNALAGLSILAVAVEWPAPRRLAAIGATIVALIYYALDGRDWAYTINHAVNHLRLREPVAADADDEQVRTYPTANFGMWKFHYVRTASEPNLDQMFLKEDENATVLGIRYSELDSPARASEAALFINSKPEASCSVAGSDLNTQLLIAHLPLLFNPKAKTLMMIGYGSGITLGTAMLHPSLERADLAEISHAVLQAHDVFKQFNYDVLNNPKVHAYHDDARSFLRVVPKKYDVIISEPSNPWIAGVSGLFTRQFFEEAKSRLNPGGILCVWFHQYEMSDENVQLVMRTLADVFPENVYAFLPDHSDIICLVSPDPIHPDFAAMEDRFEVPAVRNELAKIRVFDLSTLFGYHLLSPSRFRDFIGEGPINTDDHQRLEYAAPRSLFLGVNSTYLQGIDGHGKSPDGSSDHLLDRYIAYRQGLGEPVSKQELQVVAIHIDTMHNPPANPFIEPRESALTQAVLGRMEQATAEKSLSYRPARGGVLDPSSAGFVEANNRAAVLFMLGEREPAKTLMLRGLELSPTNLECRINLAVLLRAEEQFDEALKVLENGLAQNPNNGRLLIQVASTYMSMGRNDEARKVLEILVAPDWNNADSTALSLLGNLLEQQGDIENAINAYQIAVQNNVYLWQPAVRLIRLLWQNPEAQARALDTLDRMLKYTPHNQQLLALQSELLATPPEAN